MKKDMENALDNMKKKNVEDPDIVMARAGEALDLLAEYATDFSRSTIDRDETASILKIISDYLLYQADCIAD